MTKDSPGWRISFFVVVIHEKNTQNVLDGFTQNSRCKMFVSLQTYHGKKVAIRSTAKAVKFLLQNGYIFILIYLYLL